MYNIVFMGTPQFAVPALDILNKNHNIQLVISQPDRVNRRGKKISYNPVKQYAIDNDLDIFQPENINSDESVNKIKDLNPDFIVVVAYGQFIGKAVRDIPTEKIVNIHASLLPKYRGAAPIHWAIMNRDEQTGVTIMEVSAGMDEGDVYLEASTSIKEKNLSQLHDELSVMGRDLILEYLNLYEDNQIVATPQDPSLATHAPKITREDGVIDFTSVNKALGQIKGLYPRPGAWIRYKGENVRVLDGTIYDKSSDSNKNPGDILSVDNEGMLVNFEDGKLLIKEIQFPNSRAMAVGDYILGNELIIGENLRSD